MTSAQIQDIIRTQALKGTPVNPGLPQPLANLVVAQSQHETGNYTSNAFIKHNNAFGYAYVPGARYQTAPGLIADNNRPVANYASVEDSTKEIIDWIYRRRKEGKFPKDLTTIKTPEQYATLLKNANYYGDSLTNYLAGVRNFFVNNPELTTAISGFSIVAVIVIVIGLLFKYKKI